ncbi:MAG: DegT/DnrJ/EryC1/StrS family aminotransferase [Deltaproteobacteria bacterium]|nr:DegT/DnrJ/EryC1/StrS family aminotransferase [Deltaproteobacteria bacterium]
MIPLARPCIGDEELRAVEAVLRSGRLVQGEHVQAFERLVAHESGLAFAVAVSSGTAALMIAIEAAGVRPGDHVATSAYSWPATANAIVRNGAVPVFVDIEPSTFNLDPESLARTLDENPRIKAVIPVHAFGAVADMTRIQPLAQQAGVALIEDAACALGSTLAMGSSRASAGSFGVAGCFSFHPRKTFTTGEGGAIVTNDPNVVRRARALRNHGLDPDSEAPDFCEAGYNFRMTEIQAALGVCQLGKLRRLLDGRRALAVTYERLLRGSAIRAPVEPIGGGHSFQSYVVLLPPAWSGTRANLIRSLRGRGVEVQIGTVHVPLTSYFRRFGHRLGDFPITDDIAERALSLPMYEGLKRDEQQVVVEALVAELSS